MQFGCQRGRGWFATTQSKITINISIKGSILYSLEILLDQCRELLRWHRRLLRKPFFWGPANRARVVSSPRGWLGNSSLGRNLSIKLRITIPEDLVLLSSQPFVPNQMTMWPYVDLNASPRAMPVRLSPPKRIGKAEDSQQNI